MAERANYLREIEFLVDQAENFTEALTLVAETPKISMLAIDEAETEGDATEFLTTLKRSNPRLPILWLCEQGIPMTAFGEFKPNAYVDTDNGVAELRQAIMDQLSADFYPESLIREMIAAGNMVMSVTFQLAVDIDRPILKLSQSLPGNLTSIMLLSGKEIDAHIVVNGDADHIGKMAEDLGLAESETYTRDDAAMLAGEFVNQIAGNFQKRFEKEGFSSQLTLPVTIFGTDQSARYATVKPSLSMGLQVEGGLITVEFGCTTVRKEAFEKANEGSSKDGEVSFL